MNTIRLTNVFLIELYEYSLWKDGTPRLGTFFIATSTLRSIKCLTSFLGDTTSQPKINIYVLTRDSPSLYTNTSMIHYTFGHQFLRHHLYERPKDPQAVTKKAILRNSVPTKSWSPLYVRYVSYNIFLSFFLLMNLCKGIRSRNGQAIGLMTEFSLLHETKTRDSRSFFVANDN